MMERQFLSKRSVAAFFDTSPSTISRWGEAGGLPQPVQIGGLVRWPVDTLMRAAARLAEAGCTEHEIMAITGHKTLAKVLRYTRQARQKQRATAAMVKLSGCLKRQPAERPMNIFGKAGENGLP